MSTVGILGAGKLGTVLARLSVAAGHRTLIAGSGDPGAIGLIVDVMSPGALAMRAVEVARQSDIVVLAVPLSRFRTVPADQLRGKVVIDAMNYWPSVDGPLPEFEKGVPSSVIVADALPGTRLVKAFSHLGYHQLDEDARPSAAPDRHAVAIAGDDARAVQAGADLIDQLGFDPIAAGALAVSDRFGPGSALFGLSADRSTVEQLLAAAIVSRPFEPSGAEIA